MFQKGVSGNPAGRPLGAKDQKWKSIQAMWDLLMKEWDKLSPKERAHFSFEMVKLHFERAIAQIPKEQTDSVMNANKLLEEIKQLEANFGRQSTDTPSVANRPVEVQAEPPAKGSEGLAS